METINAPEIYPGTEQLSTTKNYPASRGPWWETEKVYFRDSINTSFKETAGSKWHHVESSDERPGTPSSNYHIQEVLEEQRASTKHKHTTLFTCISNE